MGEAGGFRDSGLYLLLEIVAISPILLVAWQ